MQRLQAPVAALKADIRLRSSASNEAAQPHLALRARIASFLSEDHGEEGVSRQERDKGAWGREEAEACVRYTNHRQTPHPYSRRYQGAIKALLRRY